MARRNGAGSVSAKTENGARLADCPGKEQRDLKAEPTQAQIDHAERLIAEGRAETGRSCGTCSQCCKLLDIDALEKPANTWCQHCRPGKGGCNIYQTRPPVCRSFACEWLVNPMFGDHWKPDRSKIVAHLKEGKDCVCRLWLVVDPSVPERWRTEPYHSDIRRLALIGLRTSSWRVKINVGKRSYTILPDQDVETTGSVAQYVAQTGPDKWFLIPFATMQQAEQFYAGLEAFTQDIAALTEEERHILLAEIIKQDGGGAS